MQFRTVSSMEGTGFAYLSPDLADTVIRDWGAKELYLNKGNWRLKSTGRIASYNTELKRRGVTWEELQAELAKRTKPAKQPIDALMAFRLRQRGLRFDDHAEYTNPRVAEIAKRVNALQGELYDLDEELRVLAGGNETLLDMPSEEEQ